MTPRRVLLVSPLEPSGVTWLLNCLLELGVRVVRDSVRPMWIADGDGWTLAPHEEILKKWLPSLSLRSRFAFRPDLEVRWTHEWPAVATEGQPLLLFVRDPRDALLSRFKREAGALSFAEFLAFPDPRTLLDKPDHWRRFLGAWLARRPAAVLRFEDYKRDAAGTLEAALRALGVDAPAGKRARAAEASTFEKAAAAERAYRDAHPEDRQVINRAGVPGDWRGRPEYEADMRAIAARCAALMRELGYEADTGPAPADDGDRRAEVVRAFLARVDRDLVARAALPPQERDALAGALHDFLRDPAASARLREAGLAPAPQGPVRAILRRVAGWAAGRGA